MEKNTTQQKAAINITVYGNGLKSKDFASQVTTAINPDGKDVRNFIFRTANIAIAQNENDKSASLFIVISNDEEDTEVKRLLQSLKRTNIPYILLLTTQEEAIHKSIDAITALEKALDMGFSVSDFADIYKRGILIDKIRQQLSIFRNGISKASLKKAARVNDGIFPLSKDAALQYASFYDSKKDNFSLTKFVPASGAASRMFKFLCEFLADFDPETQTINAYINRKKSTELSVFLVGLDKFPFFEKIMHVLKQDPKYPEWNKNTRSYKFIQTMLNSSEFDYANKPKGILPFHQYGDFTATPIYEHLIESTAYAFSKNQAHVHFTISDEHLDGFIDSIEDVKQDIEAESGVNIDVSFSYQHKYTDTLAVDMNNAPFRNSDGSLLFRPGGHGALIENLGKLNTDIVFIKNIDNVSHNNREVIALYKKALAGILIELQEQLFSYLNRIAQDNIEEADIESIFIFAKEKLSLHIPDDVAKYTTANKIEFVKQLLDRPIRVCGMVKNEGEPGGGPFWVEEGKGRLSLQIVESSQINLEDKNQHQIFTGSTHFNPVDLVCGLKNYKGGFFDLSRFVDSSSGFIVYKNKFGKDVKSYELPGLWNGAMAGWITVFVEVPLETFNPVKTVNDLLKPAHQPH